MQNNRLGKGLDSLIPRTSQTIEPSATKDGQQKVLNLEISQVSPNPDQPRKDFDDAALEDLAASIKEKGVIQPILVQEAGFGSYVIIAGERRYRASKKAGLTHIPAIVRKYDEEETLEIALIENLQREDLNPLEEAQAFQKLIEHFNMTQDAIATRLGKSRSGIANALRLLKLPEFVLDSLRRNDLSAGHARAILSIQGNPEVQVEFAKKMLETGLSVREAETASKLISSGKSVEEALASEKPVAASPGASEEIKSVRDISRGATIQDSSADSASNSKDGIVRSPELWDMEEQLIVKLGTKVQIKGSLESGKIEVSYYSMDDLGRVFELLTKAKV